MEKVMKQKAIFTWIIIEVCISTVCGVREYILNTLYYQETYNVFDGEAPTEIFFQPDGLNLIIGNNAYKVSDFNDTLYKTKGQRPPNNLPLVDKVGNTIEKKGGKAIFTVLKTRESHQIYTAECHNIYQIVQDYNRGYVLLISRPDNEPFGKLHSFNSVEFIIGTKGIVTYIGPIIDHNNISAIAVDQHTGNMAIVTVTSTSLWTLYQYIPKSERREASKTRFFFLNQNKKTNGNIPITADQSLEHKSLLTKTENIETDTDVNDFKKEFNRIADRLILLNSKGIKALVIENRKLRQQLKILEEKHEYILASANVEISPFWSNLSTAIYSSTIDSNIGQFKNSLIDARNDLEVYYNKMCHK